MPSLRTIESVWRYDPPWFEVDEKDQDGTLTGAKAKMFTTWLKFSDGSMARVFSPEITEARTFQQLQHLEDEECELQLEEDGQTKKGAPRWRLKSWPGKKGSKLEITSGKPLLDSGGSGWVEGEAPQPDSPDSSGRWDQQASSDVPGTDAPETEEGGVGSGAALVAKPTPPALDPLPVSEVARALDAIPQGPVADSDDWQVALDHLGITSRAAIRVAFRKRYGKSLMECYGDSDTIPVSALDDIMANGL